MRISVVLCTYNGERYLREQLDSVFSQTLRADEVLVSDDGSTDSTWAILEDYAARYPEMRLCRHGAPHGVNANFYSALREATGDLLVIGDQDDIWLPRKIERLSDSVGDNLLVASMNRPFTSSDDPSALASQDTRVPNVSLLRMLHTSCVAGHTMALRPALLSFVSPTARESIMYDAMLQIVARAAGRMAFVEEVLVLQRRHTASATYTSPVNRSKTLSNILRTVRDDCRLYSITRPAWRRRMLLMLDILSFVASRVEAPGEELRSALEYVRLQLNGTYAARTLFCLRHHRELLHSVERNTLYSLLRALFFPISSASYVRP
jgi:glycosyltransferase involved in cell wall biosynthesis